ncbi:hypothetical protein PROFUN_11548 [Planoprotostelium fungivorum]|uniref:Reverse transcriptase domain-containing protein n=1 Tax=Planoprotostelium fungivorum TaxID=1890364 RepID=A0A2P6N9H8_9EUKA|nr:hypothetical protein PROFUN_11548 [Planoprotostelium fungivorum]
MIYRETEEKDIDLLFMSHTGLNLINTTSANKYHQPTNNYKLILFSEDKRHSAMGILYKKDLDSYIHITDRSGKLRHIMISITGTHSTLKIMSIYAPPEQKSRTEWIKEIQPIITQQTPHIILGDFNEYENVNLDKHSTHRHPSEGQHIFIDLLTSLQYTDSFRHHHPLRREYTFFKYTQKDQRTLETRSRIDHIYTKHTHTGIDHHIDEEDTFHSDHRMVTLTIEHTMGPRSIRTKEFIPRTRFRNLKQEIWDQYKENIKKADLSQWDSSMNINEKEEFIRRTILSSMEETCPKTKPPPPRRGYILTEKERLLHHDFKQLNRIFQMTRQSDSLDNISIDDTKQLYEKYLTTWEDTDCVSTFHRRINKCRSKISKRLNAIVKKRTNEEIKERVEDIVNEIEEQPNLAYKIIKTRAEFIDICAARDDEGKVHVEPTEVKAAVRDAWTPIFQSKGRIEPKHFFENTDPIGKKEILAEITMQELNDTLRSLKQNKSPGMTEIPNEALNNSPPELKEKMLELMNDVIQRHQLPDTWRTASVSMIYKDKDKANPLNYRPISLLDTVYKTLSHIITSRLTKVVEENKILSHRQFGFRANRSTTHCITDLISCITDSHQRNKSLHVAYLDAMKAFDSVEYEAIFNSLRQYNFHSDVIDIIRTLLNGNTIEIKTAHGNTNPIEITRGVRQGDIISPILFLLYINPLIERLEESGLGYTRSDGRTINSTWLADDGVLLAHTREDLERMINIVIEFCRENHLMINEEKSAYAWNHDKKEEPIMIQPQNKPITTIGNCTPYRYLGWLITLSLDWTPMYKQIETSYKRIVGMILRKKYFGTNLHIKLINTVAIP